MFHSSALTTSVSELERFADTFKDKADRVSEDIRRLEKYLNDKFIGIEIGLNVQDHKIDDEHMKLFQLAGLEKDLDFLLREFLVWGKDEGSQKFRLLYEKHSLKGDKVNGYRVCPERKPLIECPLFDRLRMHSKLPLLVEHIKNCLAWE